MENDPDLPEQNLTQEEEGGGLPMVFQVLMWILTILAVIYAVKTRTLDDFIKYGSYIVIAISIILLLIFIVYIIRSGIKDSLEWSIVLMMLLIMPIALFIGAIAYYSISVSLKDMVLWILSPTLSKPSAITLTALFTIVVGLGLFYFRLKARAIYGLTEAVVGLVVSTERVMVQPSQLTTSGFYLALLTASVYLFVRGLDNIHQGLTKDPIDPYGLKIYAFLRKKI